MRESDTLSLYVPTLRGAPALYSWAAFGPADAQHFCVVWIMRGRISIQSCVLMGGKRRLYLQTAQASWRLQQSVSSASPVLPVQPAAWSAAAALRAAQRCPCCASALSTHPQRTAFPRRPPQTPRMMQRRLQTSAYCLLRMNTNIGQPNPKSLGSHDSSPTRAMHAEASSMPQDCRGCHM